MLRQSANIARFRPAILSRSVDILHSAIDIPNNSQKVGNSMQVGIAGAGAIALGYAAFLLQNGHSASVWSPSGNRTAAFADGEPLKVTGAIEGSFSPEVCNDAEELAKRDVIVLALPANGHRYVLDALLPHIEARHCVIISSHLSFAALYLSKKLAERSIQIPIAVWNTTILTSKAQSSTEIKVGAVRAKVDMAVVPVRFGAHAQAICEQLFGDKFIVKDDILTIALSNLNPQNHMGIALCNLTRMERGETWGQRSNVTPAVGRLLEALDQERRSIAAAFGKSVRTVLEHYALSFGVSGDSVAGISQTLAEQGKDPFGPRDISTRYILEDVPFGLVPTVHLAQMCSVVTPLHKSGIEILGACCGRDFTADNDLLSELGLTCTAELIKLGVNGYA
jgi:opine dehydrogenase